MRLAERSLQFAELCRREARPMSLLFDRFAGAARRQRQRALVLVFSRRHVIGRRRRRTLVPGLGRRPGTVQHNVLRAGTRHQVSGAACHIRLRNLTVLAQRKAVVIVVVVIVVAVAAAAVIHAEISLAVLVMVVQKHLGHRGIHLTDSNVRYPLRPTISQLLYTIQ